MALGKQGTPQGAYERPASPQGGKPNEVGSTTTPGKSAGDGIVAENIAPNPNRPH